MPSKETKLKAFCGTPSCPAVASRKVKLPLRAGGEIPVILMMMACNEVPFVHPDGPSRTNRSIG